MTLFRGFVAVLCCCLALTAAAPIAAAADAAEGRAAFDEGQRRFLAGDYREALTAFKRGHAATNDPAFLLNMAQCHRALGERSEALAMFKTYLQASPEGSNPDARAAASQAVRELEGEAAAKPSGSIKLGATPATPGVEPPPLPAGGGRKYSQGPGGLPVLEPLPEREIKGAAAPPEPTPAESMTATPAPASPTKARRLRIAGIACGAAGAGALGIGFAYWLRARSLSDSANGALIYQNGDYDAGRRAETMQWVFYAGGAAAIATGAALYYYGWRSSKRAGNVGLLPVMGPGLAGLSAQGAF